MSLSESVYVIDAKILLIGPTAMLEGLTEWEIAKLQLETEKILRRNTIAILRINHERALRQEHIISHLNAAIGRDAISDVYFLTLRVGEVRFNSELKSQ